MKVDRTKHTRENLQGKSAAELDAITLEAHNRINHSLGTHQKVKLTPFKRFTFGKGGANADIISETDYWYHPDKNGEFVRWQALPKWVRLIAMLYRK